MTIMPTGCIVNVGVPAGHHSCPPVPSHRASRAPQVGYRRRLQICYRRRQGAPPRVTTSRPLSRSTAVAARQGALPPPPGRTVKKKLFNGLHDVLRKQLFEGSAQVPSTSNVRK